MSMSPVSEVTVHMLTHGLRMLMDPSVADESAFTDVLDAVADRLTIELGRTLNDVRDYMLVALSVFENAKKSVRDPIQVEDAARWIVDSIATELGHDFERKFNWGWETMGAVLIVDTNVSVRVEISVASTLRIGIKGRVDPDHLERGRRHGVDLLGGEPNDVELVGLRKRPEYPFPTVVARTEIDDDGEAVLVFCRPSQFFPTSELPN